MTDILKVEIVIFADDYIFVTDSESNPSSCWLNYPKSYWLYSLRRTITFNWFVKNTTFICRRRTADQMIIIDNDQTFMLGFVVELEMIIGFVELYVLKWRQILNFGILIETDHTGM